MEFAYVVSYFFSLTYLPSIFGFLLPSLTSGRNLLPWGHEGQAYLTIFWQLFVLHTQHTSIRAHAMYTLGYEVSIFHMYVVLGSMVVLTCENFLLVVRMTPPLSVKVDTIPYKQ